MALYIFKTVHFKVIHNKHSFLPCFSVCRLTVYYLFQRKMTFCIMLILFVKSTWWRTHVKKQSPLFFSLHPKKVNLGACGSQTRGNGKMHVLGVVDDHLTLQPVMIFLYAFNPFAFDHKSRLICSFGNFRNNFFLPCTGICTARVRISNSVSTFHRSSAYRVEIKIKSSWAGFVACVSGRFPA